MSEVFSIRSAPRPSPFDLGIDYKAAIDWFKVWTTLTNIKAHIKDLCAMEHKPYLDMLYEARVYRMSERPEPLQKLLDDDYTINKILAMLQEAADETKDASADQMTSMTWQARYVLAKLQTTRMRYDPDACNAGLPLLADVDFNGRLDTILNWMKVQLVKVLTELDTLLPGMRYEEVYTLEGPDHDIATVGTLLPDSKLQARQAEMHQTDVLAENWERDHRIRCVLCLEAYTTCDPAFQLTCNHIVGQTCMSAWLNSTNGQATSCPHCKQVLCPPRTRTMISPTDEQIARANTLRIHRDKVGKIAAIALRVVLKAYGLVQAQMVAEHVVSVINAELVCNGVQFRLLSQYVEDLDKLVIGIRRW
ncbi:RING-type E3 ubiquitin transferase [Ascochyta rabiei]|uniref:RING-type E3 ubiquitin transferase n=1 Tax=Didymella rabiei TaxID=5454 RepID=UPI001901C134|nr:RING-type E3 ubiquitin transferase [Ascochyta rabiei]UPX19288.1 RING-type E3 ubiquitin transferase [Ascochyta rabiei]